MPNYKQQLITHLDYGGYNRDFKGSAKLVHLHKTGTVIEFKSLENVVEDVDYVVPTGKKLIIMYVDTMIDGASTCRLDQTDTADSQVGVVNIIAYVRCPLMHDKTFIAEIPAGKYITIRQFSTAVYTIELTGMEVNI